MEAKASYFSASELRCKCGICNKKVPHGIQQFALNELDKLRAAYGRGLVLTSAYRCDKHPSERTKSKPGQHNLGTAFDIKVTDGAMAYDIMNLAFAQGWTGIAYGNGFVHVDWRDSIPVTWRY